MMVALPPDIQHLVDALYPPERQALALRVALQGRTLFWIGTMLQLAIFAALYFSGAATWLREALEQRIRRPFFVNIFVVAAVVIASSIIMLPFTWYESYTFPHRYDLSRESPADWFHDWAVALALGASIAAFGGALFFWLARRLPRAWPVVAAALAAPIILISTVILPVFIEPLFNTYTPLPPSPLTKSILDLAAQHGVHASAVYVFNLSKQETASNAFVSGLGSSERIALSDTLLQTFQPDEALYVTAHELGHYVHGDLWRGAWYAWLGSLVVIAVVYFAGGALVRRTPKRARDLSDPVAAPLLLALLLVFGLLAHPVGNALSRQIEHNADVFAAANTRLGTAGVRAFARIGSQGLSTLHPDPLVVWYFYTHPPLDERIWYAAREAGLLGVRN
jgi:STE24 endopeptidase